MRIFLTLDYELYLGANTGSPENCLVRPMDELCRVSDLYGFRYVIFVDAAYILRLSQLSIKYPQLAKDYEMVTQNIKKLVNLKHDVQLHFHPQWLHSEYDQINKKWILNKMPYKLSDMKDDEVFSSFHEAKELLDQLAGYKTYAFRAGGYCLTSFEKYKELFLREGITIDSSVARGLSESTSIHAYDYRKVPEGTIYRFDDNVCVENTNGKFTELSISSVHWRGLHYMFLVRPRMMAYHPKVVYGDGQSIIDVPTNKSKGTFAAKIGKFFNPYQNLVCIDEIRSCQLEYIYNNFKKRGEKDLVLIGHPKAASDRSVKNLEAFVACCKNDIICTTKDLYNI